MIGSADDLVTTKDETRKGFLRAALRKGREANPFIEEARALKIIAENCNDLLDLVSQDNIRQKLAQAAGISLKAFKHINDKDIDDIIVKFFEEYILPAENSIDELIFRYLLACGESLGGKMRNIIGRLAEELLITKFIAILRLENINSSVYIKRLNQWLDVEKVTPDDYMDTCSISYLNKKGPRLLTFNKTIPIVGKNVDISLLESTRPVSRVTTRNLKNISLFLAFGELKGGFDPAGADEHWKTARTALMRVRTAFSSENQPVLTFFVGAAIERSMAKEIYEDFKNQRLNFCANLNKLEQVDFLSRQIISV